jgi:2-desacetyl-2-hydroxyethyl bacteriochlorophyllide A dehydrogenase
MKAITQHRYGSEDAWTLQEVDPPDVGSKDVLVQVHAAGLDRGTWHLLHGLPYVVRLAGYGLRAPKSPVPGLELSGRVVEVGRDVTAFAPGDEVFGVGRGAFAEQACAPEHRLVARPTSISAEAAAIATSGITALQAVRDHAQVKREHRVLVVGASGGVGTLAVQMAKAYGAEVSGMCSHAKMDMVHALGADQVFDYAQCDLSDIGCFDSIIDLGGNRSLASLRRALKRHGRLVIVGGEGGGRWLGGSDRQLRAGLLTRFVPQTLGGFITKETQRDLLVLKEHIEAGTVRPVIDRTYPLSEAAKALNYLAEGHARGKVVLIVGDQTG